MLQFNKCSRDIFCKYINDSQEDKFAKTFVSKADFQKQWQFCVGMFDNDELMGAIITTHSKREPKVANLQLLHTFYKHRRKGVASKLVQHSINKSMIDQCMYYRVSAEPDAVIFYESIGFKMLGEQKSGCQLSMFRIQSELASEGMYNLKDPTIRKNVYKKGKGGCVKVFDGL
tara:strand:+ start:3176 stop:3694 length:519 start_codon:yes stop_codon:yes gene_type:complete